MNLPNRAAFVMALTMNPSSLSAASITNWVKGYPITREGELVGCALEFNAFTQDYAYRQGKWVGIVGSINLNYVNDPEKFPYYLGYKLIISEENQDQVVSVAPFSIHLVSSTGAIWKGDSKQSYLSDTPGGRYQILLPEDAMVQLFEGIAKNKSFTVAFNRESGGSDVRVPLDLTVEQYNLKTGGTKRSDLAVKNWMECTEKILAQLRK